MLSMTILHMVGQEMEVLSLHMPTLKTCRSLICHPKECRRRLINPCQNWITIEHQQRYQGIEGMQETWKCEDTPLVRRFVAGVNSYCPDDCQNPGAANFHIQGQYCLRATLESERLQFRHYVNP